MTEDEIKLLGLTKVTTEAKECLSMCKIIYPENPEKLFRWFQYRPELFTFGMSDCADEEFTTGKAPSPILERKGKMVFVNIGVETGRNKWLGLPIYQRQKFEIDLTKL